MFFAFSRNFEVSMKNSIEIEAASSTSIKRVGTQFEGNEVSLILQKLIDFFQSRYVLGFIKPHIISVKVKPTM